MSFLGIPNSGKGSGSRVAIKGKGTKGLFI